jgi:aspartyl-tRNA(Asn)/glutamyl-tRNA(Gln) amidotransferase subunit A
MGRPGFDAPVDADGIAAVEQAARILSDAGAAVEAYDPDLPDTSLVFARLWGASLARLALTMEPARRAMLDPGILAVAQQLQGMTAIEFMDAEAMRAAAGHAMGRVHQRYDLILCPTVPNGPSLADAPTEDPVRALMTQWAPWTFAFNITRQPAITVPFGFRGDGLPNSVQIAAAQYRDDLVFRAARAIERAQPAAVA